MLILPSRYLEETGGLRLLGLSPKRERAWVKTYANPPTGRSREKKEPTDSEICYNGSFESGRQEKARPGKTRKAAKEKRVTAWEMKRC